MVILLHVPSKDEGFYWLLYCTNWFVQGMNRSKDITSVIKRGPMQLLRRSKVLHCPASEWSG